jgi:nucleoside-diphosphate-sugar epimerase
MTTAHPERTVLLLGARGRFGAAAAAAYAEAGWQVLAQVRRPGVPAHPAVRELALPLEHTEALAEAARGATMVVHAANPAYTRWAQELLPMARQAMDVAARLGATFLLPGNVYAYGQAMPTRLRTDTPEQPDTRKGHLRAEMEAELARRSASGLPAVVIRAGDFFGCEEGTWFDLAITKSVDQGRLVYPGPLDALHAWAYLPDLARTFVRVSERLLQRGPRLELLRVHFPGHSLTGAQLLAQIETLLGRGPLKIRGMPWGLMRLGGSVVPMWREVAEMAYLWRVPHLLDGQALATLIGPIPETTVDDALKATLERLGLRPKQAAPLGGAVAA